MLQPIDSRKCPRCGLQINNRDAACSHCVGVHSKDTVNMRDTYLNKMHSLNYKLVSRFKFISVVIFILLLISWL
jgi:hypothetical protein